MPDTLKIWAEHGEPVRFIVTKLSDRTIRIVREEDAEGNYTGQGLFELEQTRASIKWFDRDGDLCSNDIPDHVWYGIWRWHLGINLPSCDRPDPATSWMHHGERNA